MMNLLCFRELPSLARFQRISISAFQLLIFRLQLFSLSAFQRFDRPLSHSPWSRSLFNPFQLFSFSVFQFLFAVSLFETTFAQTNVTPDQYLASQPKPAFAPGHHLPLLTRWAFLPLSSNATVELANNWGYALALSGYATPAIAANVTNPGTFDYGMAQLAKNNPAKYKLSVQLDTTFPSPIPNGFYVTNASGWFVDVNTNTWQYLTNTNYTPVVSPEAPDNYLSNAAAYDVASLMSIQSNVPIAIVLNGGEYGLSVSARNSNAWRFDPRVVAARATNGLDLYRYTSNQKAHQLGFTTVAINQAFPNRELYIYYNTTIEFYRFGAGWETASGFNSDVIVTNTDLPSFEDYYHYHTTGYWTNWTIRPFGYDMLTEHLDGVGYIMALGHSTNYSWVCAGFDQGDGPSDFSDMPHYMGFLKCIYTAGTVGAVAYYQGWKSNGFTASFATTNPPNWVLQVMALSHVHALFTHFDNFLTSGDLLSGPQHHAESADQPAYEFTNTVADATARVLARKLHNANQWLITAWAAAGPDRTVTVTIPTLGSVSVLARSCGSVYTATLTNLTLIDVDGLLPSASFGAPGPPSNLHVVTGSTN